MRSKLACVSRFVLASALVLGLGCPASDTEPSGAAGADLQAGQPSPVVPRAAPPSAPPPVQSPPIRKDGTMFGTSELMGTTVSLNVYVGPSGDSTKAGAAMEAALGEMARIESIMSEWRPRSELSKLNASAGGEPIEVSSELFEVLERAKAIHGITGGSFDVTFHGVGHLWSFKPGATPPSPAAIKAALPTIDGAAVELDEQARSVRLPKKGMKVGLGAIAKGYAVDRASSLLEARGFVNHVVEAGGDTYASGTKGGSPWRVGVQNPDGGAPLGVLSVSQRAVVTSGDYMRFFEHEGTSYAHILDPRTGWPVEREKSPKSVTVVAANATDADAYCTAVSVMGPEAGLAFVESRPGVDAVIIARDGAVAVSSGLTDMYETLPPVAPEL